MFEDQFLRAVVRRLFWLGIAATITIVMLASINVVLALRPAAKPYVVELDHGKVIGFAQVFPADQALQAQAIRKQVEDFITYCRMVSNNMEFEQHNVHVVYAMARGQAMRALEDYYRGSKDRDPILLANAGYWREVHIIRVLQEPAEPHTWRVEWSEIAHPQMGDPTTTNWEALMRVVVTEPDTDNELNPLGVYIVSLDFKQSS